MSHNKAIPDGDKQSFTSIITLYQCNLELLKLFREERKRLQPDVPRDKRKMDEYLKFRPKEEEVELFSEYCLTFWVSFRTNFTSISDFLALKTDQAALEFRNRESGGNLLFRPIGLLPIVQVAVEIRKRKNKDFGEIFNKLNAVDMTISSKPWRNVVWNPNEKTMIMGSSSLVKLLLLYIYGESVISLAEIKSLKEKYADRIASEELSTVLHDIQVLD